MHLQSFDQSVNQKLHVRPIELRQSGRKSHQNMVQPSITFRTEMYLGMLVGIASFHLYVNFLKLLEVHRKFTFYPYGEKPLVIPLLPKFACGFPSPT